ncbi:Phospholipase A I [Paramyrothecium foliicola]|nr:Phospholipase A I [Paramyrothecium foliicola]
MADRGPRLLSLDGGGVRGLSSLLILKQLMEAVNQEAPPKPCDYFDLIGGTSTGGLIAIMLGRLELSVDECIAAYTSLWNGVFQKKRHRMSITGQLQGRFDSDQLEMAIKKIVTERGLDKDAPLQAPKETKSKIFVCATSKETGEVVRLRSYRTHRGRSRDITIWEAGRATSAATSFFKHVVIGSYEQTFVDGALGANNPVRELWSEAQDLWPSQRLEDTVQCLVSIGTGMPSTAPFKDDIFNIGKSLVKLAIETEKTAEAFIRDKKTLRQQGRYYRFNVSRGLKNIGLEDTKQTNVIVSATDMYLETEEVSSKIQECAAMLRQGTHIKVTEPKNIDIAREDKEYLDVCERELHTQASDDRFHQVQRFSASEWFFEHESFLEWDGSATAEKKSSALLTIKGNPGTGKSVLMKEAVLASTSIESTITIYHFFGNFAQGMELSPSRNSVSEFLRSILGQLIAKVPDKPWDVIRSWGKELQAKRDAGLWSNDRLKAAIKRIILENRPARGSRVRIFVDAINDCSNQAQVASSSHETEGTLDVLQFLSELPAAAASSGIDCAVCVSRQYLPMYGAREPVAKVIDIQKHSKAQVEQYIKQQLSSLNDKDLEFRLFGLLRQHTANGFLWATVVTQQILERSLSAKVKELEHLASEVPRSLETLYQKGLSATKVSKDSQVLQLFQLVLGALRPLAAEEARHALAFVTTLQYESMQEWEKSTEGILPGSRFENFLQRESGGLIEIAAHERPDAVFELPDTKKDPNDIRQLRFIHSSAISFLRGETGLGQQHAHLRTGLDEHCHLLLFKICIHVLDFCRLRGKDDVKFLDYACEYWLRHAQKCGELVNSLEKLPTFMLSCKTKKTGRLIEEQIKLLHTSQAKESIVLEGQDTMLVLLSTMGCTSLLRRHLQTCSTCQKAIKAEDEESDAYRVALTNAIIGRWNDTASYLLELNPQGDINSLFDDTTLLYDACYFASLTTDPLDKAQRMEVVRFLLNRGADPSVASLRGYEYPLHVAIALGNEDLIEELLSTKSATAEKLLKMARIHKGWSALHFAVESQRRPRERLSVLQTLLKVAPRGVGLLETLDKDGNTPLALAEKVSGVNGEDLVEAFEDFALEEEVE